MPTAPSSTSMILLTIHAHEVSQSANLVVWFREISPHDAAYHAEKAIEYLRKAADAAGYDLVEKPAPASQEEAS